jgi:tetratricopeptide (TPR) repeat protein
MLMRWVALPLALIAGVAAIRSAAVQAWGESRPNQAAALWPSHPRPVLNQALGQIGASAGRGEAAPPAALNAISAVAARNPLAVEPFTVAGTEALAAGKLDRAELLLEEALRREPRAIAPRYLLADLFLRTGRLEQGLLHVSALTQRLGQTLQPIAPAIARFAGQPGAIEALAPAIRKDPQLADQVLGSLATDAGSAEITVQLWRALPPGQRLAAKPWQARLLEEVIGTGDYRKAHDYWRAFARIAQASPGLFNPRFASVPAQPPFNWTLTSGSGGVAEPVPGGVRLIFYGREDTVLASQTVILGSGVYRLTWQAAGEADNLIVRMTCLPQDRELGSAALSSGTLGFTIPPSSCRAQRLEFRGQLAELPATMQPSVTGLSLTRARAR